MHDLGARPVCNPDEQRQIGRRSDLCGQFLFTHQWQGGMPRSLTPSTLRQGHHIGRKRNDNALCVYQPGFPLVKDNSRAVEPPAVR